MWTIYEYREAIKNTLMRKVYAVPLIFWNRQLMELCDENTRCHGREGHFLIHYQGQKQRPEPMSWADREDDNYFLPLHPDFPDLKVRMVEIIEELDVIRREKYEAERFLSGLVLFPAPEQVFHDILGNTLFQECKVQVQQHASNTTEEWNSNADMAIHTFSNKHTAIVQAMKERIMANLLDTNTTN